MKKQTFDQIQKPLIGLVKKSLVENDNPTVLGAAPGSGKTYMSYQIAHDFKKQGVAVLVMGHSTILLKEQFFNDWVGYATDGDPEKDHGVRLLDSKAALKRFWLDRKNMSPKSKGYPWVLVGIPQSVRNADYDVLKQFDLIITDECHQNYFADTYGISRTINPKYDLCLTGTPSKFIARNEENPGEFNILTLPAEVLKENDLIDEPIVELAVSSADFRRTDYNKATDELNTAGQKKLTKKVTFTDMETIMDAIGAQLSSDEKVAEKLKGKGKTKAIFEKMGKTMIACKGHPQAKAVRDYLESKGVKCYLSICSKDEDPKSVEIQNFVKDKSGSRSLVVVGRGILGLNDHSIINIIDMNCSMNPDTILQLMARLFRKTKVERKINGKNKKLFIKLIPKELEDVARVHTSFAIAMMFREVFETYNGKYSSMITPSGLLEGEKIEGEGSGDKREGGPPRPKLHDYGFLKEVFKQYRDGVETVAMCNIRSISGLGVKIFVGTSKKINKAEAAKFENRVDYCKGSSASYQWSRKNDWLDEFFPESVMKIFRGTSKEVNRVEAAKYETSSEYHKGSSGSAKWSGEKRWMNDFFPAKMKWKWSPKKVNKDEAAKYKNVSVYAAKSPGSHRWSKKKGWLPEFFPNGKKVWIGTSKKINKAEAAKYETRKAYQLGSAGSCNWSRGKGWLDEFHPSGNSKQWKGTPKKENKTEAAKYKTLTAYRKGQPSSHKWSKKKGWLAEFFPKCVEKEKKWKGTSKKVNKAEAAKYKTRTEYSRGSGASYTWSNENDWMDEFFPKMKWKGSPKKINKAEAAKYKTISEYQKGSSGSCAWSREKKWLAEFFPNATKKWKGKTKKDHKAEAAKYKTRMGYNKGAPGSYQAALRNKWMDEFFPRKKTK